MTEETAGKVEVSAEEKAASEKAAAKAAEKAKAKAAKEAAALKSINAVLDKYVVNPAEGYDTAALAEEYGISKGAAGDLLQVARWGNTELTSAVRSGEITPRKARLEIIAKLKEQGKPSTIGGKRRVAQKSGKSGNGAAGAVATAAPSAAGGSKKATKQRGVAKAAAGKAAASSAAAKLAAAKQKRKEAATA